MGVNPGAGDLGAVPGTSARTATGIGAGLTAGSGASTPSEGGPNLSGNLRRQDSTGSGSVSGGGGGNGGWGGTGGSMAGAGSESKYGGGEVRGTRLDWNCGIAFQIGCFHGSAYGGVASCASSRTAVAHKTRWFADKPRRRSLMSARIRHTPACACGCRCTLLTSSESCCLYL